MKKIKNLAELLSHLPNWVTVPVLIIEITAILLIFGWIYFTRSVGTVEVPDLRGRDFNETKSELSSLNLRYRSEWKSSLYTPENQIMSQVPAPGTEVKENRPITLFISEGPQYVTVPDLRNNSLIEARSLLERQTTSGKSRGSGNLVIGNIARIYSDNYPADQVITQNPPPGRKVLSGSRVDVLISRGNWPRRTVVPDLLKQNIEEAEKKIRRAGLEKGTVRYVYQPDVDPDVVLDQTPPASIIIREQQPVSLTVNLSEPEEEPDYLRYTTIRINPPLSVSPGRLKAELVDRRGRSVVFEERVKPGQKVEFLTAVKGSASLIIYWNDDLYRFRRLDSQ